VWEGGDVVLLEFSSCTLVVRKLPDSSRIIFYFRSKMFPLIPYLQFVAEFDGGAGHVDAAQSHRKTLPLELYVFFYYPF